MDGSSGRRHPPVIMGHEASGIIAEVGDNVTSWKIGDRVTFDSTVYCGTCHFCTQGQINLCDRRRVLGVSCDEYCRNGAFAEYIAIPQHILYRLPDSVSFSAGAMTEPLSIAVHAARRGCSVAGDTALVVGTGMIGLMIVQVLRANGCESIIAVDPDANRLQLAKTLGANVILPADQQQVIDTCLQVTQGRGADVAFEAVGITPAINTAVSALRKGGKLVLVGNVTPAVDIPLQKVVTRELTLYGSCASTGEYPVCIDLLAEGKVNVNQLISATAPLAAGPHWFDRLHRREPGLLKVILQPDQ
jgi:L-iditol 2-dehydrogenase